jgi:hypothetical protein
VIADTGDFGACLRTQLFKLSQRTGEYDLPNSTGNGLANACVSREVRVIPYKLIKAFRQRPNLAGRPLIGFNLERIFLLHRKQLRKAGQPIGNLSVAEDQRGRRD